MKSSNLTRWRRFLAILALPLLALGLGAMVALLVGMLPFRPAAANHGPYTVGDVFASVRHFDSGTGTFHNTVRRYSSTGVLLETLDTGATNYTAAGSCFDGSGQQRVTNFSDNTVTLFGAPGTGTTTYPWVSGISNDPESCRVENAPSGNVFVGVADGDQDVRKFAPGGGAPLATYNVATENRGSDFVDLLPTDNCQLYYTSEGVLIKRFDVCTNTQLPDFATVPSGGPCFAVRVRPDGHVFVACSDRVFHLDATGANVAPSPYLRSSLVSPSGGSEFGTLFAMNLDPDNATLWTGGLQTGNIYRINIATGLQVTTFPGFQANDNTLGGLTIFGEIGPPPPGGSTPGKVTGGGSIEGDPIFSLTGDLISAPAIILGPNGIDKATFGFVVNDGASPTGNLSYHDHETGDDIKATSITALFIGPGPCGVDTHARFTGKATVNGVPNQDFEVNVDDCGEPGSAPGVGPDTFGIAVTGGYANGPKPLIGGNIQIHK